MHDGLGHGEFTAVDARAAAGRAGIHFDDEAAFEALMSEFVEDVLDETVTPSGDRVFAFPVPRRERAASAHARAPHTKRGAQVAGHDAGGDGFVTTADGGGPLASPPPARSAGRRRALAASTGTTTLVSPPAPAPSGKDIVNIAPPHVDGGTTLSIKTSRESWCGELRSIARHRGRLPVTTSLTTSAGDAFTASLKRMENGGVSLIFDGEAQLDLHRSGHVNLIAKAEALWTSTVEDWLTTWLVRASEWLCGPACSSLADAVALGWRVSKLEVAADFTGVVFRDGDQALFTGHGRKGDVRSEGFRFDASVETINVGRRGRGRLSVSTHDKTQAVRKTHRCQAEESFYAPTWVAHGWNRADPIRRVEARASGGALHLYTEDGELLDLREPMALLDPAKLHSLWRYATTRVRLAERPTGASSSFRARRAPVDPRWIAVQNAAPVDGPRIFRVRRAPARELAMKELEERTRRDVERSLAGLASRLGLPPRTVERVAHQLVRALRDHRSVDLRPSAGAGTVTLST
jgi:hypothetical protein